MSQRLRLANSKLQLFAYYEDRHICKEIYGAKWNRKAKCWEYPLRPEVFQEILDNFPGLSVDAPAKAAIDTIAEREAMAARAKMAPRDELKPVRPMPIKTKPFRHQVAGYNFVCELWGIADEPTEGGDISSV